MQCVGYATSLLSEHRSLTYQTLKITLKKLHKLIMAVLTFHCLRKAFYYLFLDNKVILM
jgi:hypothetical protein